MQKKSPSEEVKQELKAKQSPLVSMRMKPEDKERFLKAANADGDKSLTTWLKKLARERADKLGIE